MNNKQPNNPHADHLACPTCWGLFVEPVVLVPCGHSFCAGCMTSITKCPVCRAAVQARVANRTLASFLAALVETNQIRAPLLGGDLIQEYKQALSKRGGRGQLTWCLLEKEERQRQWDEKLQQEFQREQQRQLELLRRKLHEQEQKRYSERQYLQDKVQRLEQQVDDQHTVLQHQHRELEEQQRRLDLKDRQLATRKDQVDELREQKRLLLKKLKQRR